MNTGLMYLCKTTSGAKRDPYKYKGSGKYWIRHTKKHKSYIVTCVVGEYDSRGELRRHGLILSEQLDVVASDVWANLVPECGDGGWIHDQTGNTWRVSDPSNMGKHRNQWKNDDGTRATTQSIRMTTNNPSHNVPKTAKQLAASSKASAIATEASKKQVGYIDVDTNEQFTFESKRALIRSLNISYDVLNYRLKTGTLYNNFKFFRVDK